jgi:hypothetical protein
MKLICPLSIAIVHKYCICIHLCDDDDLRAASGARRSGDFWLLITGF